MNISMNFEGYTARIIEAAQAKGIVKTKAEALRLGLLELDHKYQLVDDAFELEADLREIERIGRDIKSGKEKIHKAKSLKDIFR